MKRFHMMKTSSIGKIVNGRLAIPFKRAVKISESESASDFRIVKKAFSDTFLTYDNLNRINEQFLRIERQKAYGIQQVLEKQRYR